MIRKFGNITCRTNIIVMNNVIFKEKIREKIRLSKGIGDTTTSAEVAQESNLINLARNYMWAMSNIDLDAVKKLGLTDIKKYWRRAVQVEIELDWLHD